MVAISFALALPASIGIAAAHSSRDDTPPATVTVTVEGGYRGVPARVLHHKLVRVRHLAYRRLLMTRRRWRPTVDYALRLASAVYGVPYRDLRAVSWCESRFFPFARNGQYKGIFQMHWAPFGFSPFDPVASALSAAQTVVHDGSWRQWQCKP